VGQFDAVELLLAHRHQQHEQAVEPGLEQDAGNHRRNVGLGFAVGAGQPDVQADGGGLGHEADGEEQEHPGRDRLFQLAERCQCKSRRWRDGVGGSKGEPGEDQESAAEREDDVGQRVRLGILAAQDQEVGTDGQQLPGGEKVEGIGGADQHRQTGIHQHRCGVEPDAPPVGMVARQQDDRATDENDDGEDQLQRVVLGVGEAEEGEHPGDGDSILDPRRQPVEQYKTQREEQRQREEKVVATE